MDAARRAPGRFRSPSQAGRTRHGETAVQPPAVMRLHLPQRPPAAEIGWVMDTLRTLSTHLPRWRGGSLVIDLVVPGRDEPRRPMSLDCWLPQPAGLRLGAVSDAPDLPGALFAVIHDVMRRAADARAGEAA